MRPARLSDSETLLKWRDDPVTRRNSFITRVITREEHEVWLPKHLSELQIIEVDGKAAGVLRMSPNGEVSVTIAPEFRHKGIASKVLKDCVNCHANIKPSNAFSIKAFLNAGFSLTRREDYLYAILES